MSCNAYNHRPGCDCGWGGVFYGLGLGVGGHYWGRPESYTNPNARCPRCSALVYFYKSPDGGSVYFDDLGPPWPKHPCMDAGTQTIWPGRTALALEMPLLAAEGWHPLLCVNIGASKGNSDIVVFDIGSDGEKQLYARRPNAKISIDSPILWRAPGTRRGIMKSRPWTRPVLGSRKFVSKPLTRCPSWKSKSASISRKPTSKTSRIGCLP